jgi:hypothetical protein
MRIHVGETHGPAAGLPDPEQASQDDAAVTAENDHEGAALRRGRDASGQRARIDCDALLVARPQALSHEVAVGGRHHVTVVPRSNARSDALLAQNAGREIEAALIPVVVGPNPDARGSTDDGDWTIHSTS